ncbi:MAG: hypothetical protein ABIA92_05945 [Patescibacteria group bacterium]
MWPFPRRKPVSKAKQSLERLVAGFIIGGAIGSIIGKKILDEHGEEEEVDELNDDE